MLAMVASQVMRSSISVSASLEAVAAARSRPTELRGRPRPLVWRRYSSLISEKTATSGDGLELLGDGCDFREAAGLAEGSQEARALSAGGAEGTELRDHDGPGEDAQDGKEQQDGEGDRAGVMEDLAECAGVGAGGGRGGDGGGDILKEGGEEWCEGFEHLGMSVLRLADRGQEQVRPRAGRAVLRGVLDASRKEREKA